jgi:hypothetical protein
MMQPRGVMSNKGRGPFTVVACTNRARQSSDILRLEAGNYRNPNAGLWYSRSPERGGKANRWPFPRHMFSAEIEQRQTSSAILDECLLEG